MAGVSEQRRARYVTLPLTTLCGWNYNSVGMDGITIRSPEAGESHPLPRGT